MLHQSLSLLPTDPLRLEELSVPELHALLAQLLPGSSAAGFVSSVSDAYSNPFASLARFTGAAGYLEVLLLLEAARASERL